MLYLHGDVGHIWNKVGSDNGVKNVICTCTDAGQEIKANTKQRLYNIPRIIN